MAAGDWQRLLEQASAFRRAGRVAEAIGVYQRLLELKPDLPDSWYNLGWLQRQARQYEPSLASYQKALEFGVAGAEEVHLNRAVILSDHLGRTEEARGELLTAVELNPAYIPALLNLGNLAEDLGDREQAREAYRRALGVEPGHPLALARLAGISAPDGPDDPIVEQVRQALERSDLSPADRADLGFALGRLLDAARAFDDAFIAYEQANADCRASFGPAFRGYDPVAAEAHIDTLIEAFPRASPDGQAGSDRSPIFICGMFRSGSTLAEQILSSHSAVTAGGELDILPWLIATELQPYPASVAKLDSSQIERLKGSYLCAIERRGLGSGVVTDKRPDNFLHIGLIKTLFPEAKIIHTLRQPLDNCLSIYFLHLDPAMAYAVDLEHIGHWYRQYRRLMDHWRRLYGDSILDLSYDALVREPRPTVQDLLNFCGLEWEEGCLDFPNADNAVRTASVWQVRERLYQSSSGRWRNYEKRIKPLRSALRGLA